MFGTAKKEEEKKPAERPTFTKGPAKADASAGGDWKKGVAAPAKDAEPPKRTGFVGGASAGVSAKSNDKGDDGWSFSGARKAPAKK
jgi:hypothetical protein